jgi:hypothetical protein
VGNSGRVSRNRQVFIYNLLYHGVLYLVEYSRPFLASFLFLEVWRSLQQGF